MPEKNVPPDLRGFRPPSTPLLQQARYCVTMAMPPPPPFLLEGKRIEKIFCILYSDGDNACRMRWNEDIFKYGTYVVKVKCLRGESNQL
jgi:hypothetical protein